MGGMGGEKQLEFTFRSLLIHDAEPDGTGLVACAMQEVPMGHAEGFCSQGLGLDLGSGTTFEV